MNTPPQNARFWVRPYEFEGDGSTGAAEDVVSLEIGGRLRTFWLKSLEGRLFFREVGRNEDWNFGALDVSDGGDLPRVLVSVLESERYGRVVLPLEAPRPCFLLAASRGQIQCRVPARQLSASTERTPPHTMFDSAFLDWAPKSFGVIASDHFLSAEVPNFWNELTQSAAPVIEPHWARGSLQEWKRTMRAFGSGVLRGGKGRGAVVELPSVSLGHPSIVDHKELSQCP